MSAAEILAELLALPSTERAAVIEKTLPQLTAEQLKLIDRAIRRIAHPEVPDEVWEGLEDAEDDRFVDMETVLRETPPPYILDRSLPRPEASE